MPDSNKTIISDSDYPSPYLLNISLSGVLGIKAYAHVAVSSSGGPSNDHSACQIYEVQAWGPAYTDIGLRYYKGGVIAIGVEALGASHKLRIRKGDTTYGIPLLETTDPNASPIRIYSGAALKALPKLVALADFVTWPGTVATYSYTGYAPSVAGPASRDGSFTTAYEQINSNGGGSLTSQHIFSAPRNITQLGFRLGCSGYAYGDSGASVSVDIHIYTTTDGVNWTERYVRSA